MGSYILRKLIYGLLVLWGVVTLVFAIFSISPGDPARMLLGQRVDEASLAMVNKELGLDLPWYKQYLLYLNDVCPVSLHSSDSESHLYFDDTKYNGRALLSASGWTLAAKWPYLRRSYQTRKEVSAIIAESMPGTVVLALVSIAFAIIIGVFFGVIAALKKDTFTDKASLLVAVLGMSAPSFFAAIIFSWVGGYLWSESTQLPMLPVVFLIAATIISLWHVKKRSFGNTVVYAFMGLLAGFGVQFLALALSYLSGLDIVPLAHQSITLPGTGLSMTGSLYDVDVIDGEYLSVKNLILPAITLGIRPLAIVVQLTRSSMLDVLSQDYIRTARSKGLAEHSIVIHHALRNAMNPVLTAVSGWFAGMLAGAVFIEYVFNWKGLGLRVFQSLQNDDFPVVMGAVLVIAASFVFLNIIVDILYGVLDPRIRLN